MPVAVGWAARPDTLSATRWVQVDERALETVRASSDWPEGHRSMMSAAGDPVAIRTEIAGQKKEGNSTPAPEFSVSLGAMIRKAWNSIQQR